MPTTLGVYWGEALWLAHRTDPDSEDAATYLALIAGSTPRQKLEALAAACDRLTADFGTWSVPWGDVNRRVMPKDAQPAPGEGKAAPKANDGKPDGRQ